MKLSRAMLKGYERVDGRQCRGSYYRGSQVAPTALCASGAVLFGAFGDPRPMLTDRHRAFTPAYSSFERAYGLSISRVNDEGMPWEHIYGMAVAAGL